MTDEECDDALKRMDRDKNGKISCDGKVYNVLCDFVLLSFFPDFLLYHMYGIHYFNFVQSL